MTFYGQENLEATKPSTTKPLRNFVYRVYDGGIEHAISANDIYFYEAGRVGFWNDDPDRPGERILVLATKAFTIREVTNR